MFFFHVVVDWLPCELLQSLEQCTLHMLYCRASRDSSACWARWMQEHCFFKVLGEKKTKHTKCAIERLLILNSNQKFCLCDNKPLQRRFFLFPFLFSPLKFHEFLQGVKIRLTYFPANTALCLRLSPPPGSPGLTSRPRYSPAPRPFPDARFG